MDTDKHNTLEMLRKWINQRPGLEPGNYDRAGYQSDSRRIQQQRRDALALLNAVALRDGITADMIRERSQHAFSGRLEIKPDSIDYCTGQYWPTEYRAAACAVLASCLWYYWRDDVPESVENKGGYLRDKARREFGVGIGRRWFN